MVAVNDSNHQKELCGWRDVFRESNHLGLFLGELLGWCQEFRINGKSTGLETLLSGWLNQPIWKILVKFASFPQTGMNIKYISSHHLVLNTQLETITHPFPNKGYVSFLE